MTLSEWHGSEFYASFEWWLGKDVEGNRCGFFEGYILEFERIEY